ncbi:MAG TPA: lactoylglutathione lyase [Gammaproteobacteria bacterium]|nr:lactoylglutathione lyase [Gammaproteobacteria bacterium]
MPTRILYTMIRVGNLDRSVTFYRDALGMQEIRRETYTKERFTLVFMGYGSEEKNALIELTYNWDKDNYEQGSGFGHLALEVPDVYAACSRLSAMGVSVVRDPGPMNFPPDESDHGEIIAFIEDPDGYKVELVEAETENNMNEGTHP